MKKKQCLTTKTITDFVQTIQKLTKYVGKIINNKKFMKIRN